MNELGSVTLVLDSFGPRGLSSVCKARSANASPNLRALDAHGALAYLRGRPDVDGERIGILGWSHGGSSALAAVNAAGIAARLPRLFVLAVAYYPGCSGGGDYDLPVLILIGDADDWTPAHRCREAKARSTDGGPTIELITYPGAFHGFDTAELARGLSVEGAYGRTHWLKYDEAAHAHAEARVESFLARHLSPP